MKDKKFYLSYTISSLMFFLYSYIFFQNIIISIFIALIVSLKFYQIVYEIFTKNNMKNKRIMFREFLDLFNSNIISSNNFYNSLVNTSEEIKYIFNEEEYIVKNLNELILDIDNGNSIENSLIKFKEKTNLEEANIFIDSLIISLKSGISISEIANISKDMINENIALEIELSIIADNAKREFIIMSFLPLIILIVLDITQKTSLELVDYLIRIPVFALFLFSFYMGHNISNLEVL